MKPLKLAHSEGHTDVCYDSSGSFILTGGSNGKVCIWEGQDDTDTTTVSIGGTIFALAFQGGRFFAATDENAIRIHTFPDGVSDGMVTRFTAPCRHFTISEDGSMLVAGSDDFKIKIISMEENECICLYSEHQAPVLSIALDPTREFIASSSCDGSVKIWNVIDGSTEKTLSILPKCSEPSQAKSLCRLCWSKDGEFLLIPLNNEIFVYLRSSWEVVKKVNNPAIKEIISVMTLSHDGKHVAVGCTNGDMGIFEWQINKLIERQSHPKHLTITSMIWNPKKSNELAFADNMGQLGFLDVAELSKQSAPGHLVNGDSTFGDFDDDMEVPSEQDGVDADDIDKFLDDDDDENSIDIGSIKRRLNPLIGLDDNGKFYSMASSRVDDDKPAMPVVVPPVMTLPDNIFKPTISLTYIYIKHALLFLCVWNSVGIVRQYTSDDENSIDVEFHDTSTHHALHIDNKLEYMMADLSTQALLLASRSDQDSPSKLLCMHFGSWDSHKEWSYDMPEGEDIQAITVAETWAAVATSLRNVRIFSIGDLQCQVFSLPGIVVALASHENKLLAVYHKGMGVPGDQYMGVSVLRVKGNTRSKVISDDTLPLSPASKLAWIGFSEEGTPFFMDSQGIVRMMNQHFGSTWTPVVNTRQHVKGKSDHYWLVSVSERLQQIRCVPCKGSRYPATLPRPALGVLPFQLPLCDVSSEKTQYEESYQRSILMARSLEKSGLVDEDELVKPVREALVKLFAFAAKSEKDFRALEVCDLMEDQSLLHIAATYASRLKRMRLAERVSGVMQKRQEEAEHRFSEAQAESEDERETNDHRSLPHTTEAEDNEEEVNGDRQLSDGEEHTQTNTGPILKTYIEKEIKAKEKPSFRPNPFKLSGSSEKNTTKGSHVFDKMEKTTPKASPIFAPLPVSIKRSTKKSGTQPKVISFSKESKKSEDTNSAQENMFSIKSEVSSRTSQKLSENMAVKKKISAFDLWYESSKDDIQATHPDLAEEDLSQKAAEGFRALTKEERQTWVEKAKTLNDASDDNTMKKRKLFSAGGDNDEGAVIQEASKKVKVESTSVKKTALSQSVNSKLARFAKSN
ncbi:unnamed protein product [Candidula unifasciata]|uniref:HMG box domain-containing protein n=1 Tax=Candidula unifasciata TaxID=100452 RepID=A0A8S3YY51_9EUPU|nr:unnamed protein product [Candidula unifasciata]